MPKCHQCDKNIKLDARSGLCSICCSSAAKFCTTCAMWELGPRDTDLISLPDALEKAPVRTLEVQRQKADKPVEDLSTVDDEVLTCHQVYEKLANICPLIKEQSNNDKATLYKTQFKKKDISEGYVCRTLATFDQLYEECCHDKLLIKILLTFHLSTQERVQCRDTKDASAKSTNKDVKHTHRWDIRTLAAKHLRQHLEAIKTEFGRKNLFPDDAPALALGWDDIEFFLKGRKHITLTAIDLLAYCEGNKELAKRVLEISVLLYHTLTAVRSRDEVKGHWSNSEETKNTFDPRDALSYLSNDFFKTLYGDSATAGEFTGDIKTQLNRLYTVLDDVGKKAQKRNHLPKHPRFRDESIPAGLSTEVKNYMQYLPTFDHPHSKIKQGTACEQVVHDRVAGKVKDILGLKRRRRGSDLLDELYVEMRNDFVVDWAFDTNVANIIIKDIDDGAEEDAFFRPKAWFPVHAEDIEVRDIFTYAECGFTDSKSSFEGVKIHYKDTRDIPGVTSGRAEHYLDWRYAKDYWLYDGFYIPMRKRPLFASLSVQPSIPEPNSNYGHHVFLIKPDSIKNSYVLTFGDKQQPCRSILLLLDRVLFSHRKKDGSEGQHAGLRLDVFGMLIERHNAIKTQKTQKEKALKTKWKEQLTRKMVPNLTSDQLFECQIFTPINIATDLAGIIITSHDVEKYGPYRGVPARATFESLRKWARIKHIPILDFEYVLHRQTRSTFNKIIWAPLAADKKAQARKKNIEGKPPD